MVEQMDKWASRKTLAGIVLCLAGAIGIFGLSRDIGSCFKNPSTIKSEYRQLQEEHIDIQNRKYPSISRDKDTLFNMDRITKNELLEHPEIISEYWQARKRVEDFKSDPELNEIRQQEDIFCKEAWPFLGYTPLFLYGILSPGLVAFGGLLVSSGLKKKKKDRKEVAYK